ncbi:hypothetical protein YC2023_061036 [Brassica napus]
MPTEASSVSPSGLAPTRENYFRPRAPLISLDIQLNAPKGLNLAGSSLSKSRTRKRLLDHGLSRGNLFSSRSEHEELGKEGLLERCPAQGKPAENEQLRTPASSFLLREAPAPTPASIPASRSIKGITRSYDLGHKWKTHTYDGWKIFDNRRNGLAQAIIYSCSRAYSHAGCEVHIMQSTALGAYTLLSGREHITYNAKVLPEELIRLLSGREHITYNAKYCLRSLHATLRQGAYYI